MVIYVGDSENVINRVLTNHCRSNISGSALRKHVAQAMGYEIKSTRRPQRSTRVQINLANPREGETHVSNYIRSGEWRYIICDSCKEARDFQWYIIEQLKPVLNKDYQPWDHNNLQRYQVLLTQLTNSSALSCTELRGMESGPGVYILYHKRQPKRGGEKGMKKGALLLAVILVLALSVGGFAQNRPEGFRGLSFGSLVDRYSPNFGEPRDYLGLSSAFREVNLNLEGGETRFSDHSNLPNWQLSPLQLKEERTMQALGQVFVIGIIVFVIVLCVWGMTHLPW